MENVQNTAAQASKQKISLDRFGNPCVIKAGYSVVDRKTGEFMPISKAYFDLGGQSYQVTVSPMSDIAIEEHKGDAKVWIKVTKLEKRPPAQI